jgi:hypothetical protein
MDWNLHNDEFVEMMAFSLSEIIRAFGRKGKTRKMLIPLQFTKFDPHAHFALNSIWYEEIICLEVES